ncbi:MAG: NAD-dependent epimerase/dehydratase family protein [Deltaproteobacteria bacterium]|nr:NAD-dependent epimerase/dehydratase family protein [Deltaproteobacteria bacterium]
MARVLVTGGAGFIGSHLVDRLIARGDEVIVLDDLSLGDRTRLPEGVRLLEGKVQEAGRFAGDLAGVTRIFHLAALISGYDSLKDADAYLDANVHGTLRLLEVAKDLPDVRVIFASSSTVYGNRPEPVRRESDVPMPITVYAASKLMGEHLLATYAPLYGYSHVSMRLFNVYGPRQNPDHPYANVTCKFACAAARGLPVALYGDGRQTRDFVYVDDVVDALLAVEPGSAEAVYNVGTGEDAPILGLLRMAEQAGTTKLQIERKGNWPNDIRAIRADSSRLTSETGWTPKVALETGMARTVEWFR